MRIATYNIQNIFFRDAALIEKNHGSKMELWREEFEQLMVSEPRTEKSISRMRDLSILLGFHSSPYKARFVMRRKDGNLLIRRDTDSQSNRSTAFSNWDGWIKLRSTPINEKAIVNKVKVIVDCLPDVLVLQEVEDRRSLVDFNRFVAEELGCNHYDQIVYLEGNDEYGRGMALMARKDFTISSIKSYSDEVNQNGNRVFDKDLVQYTIRIPTGEEVIILSVHFPSPSNEDCKSPSRRKDQMEKLIRIYNQLITSDNNNYLIGLMGTFNVPSYSTFITELLGSTNLKDTGKHRSFEVDLDRGIDGQYHRLGAYQKGVNLLQKDYILLSPALFERISSCGLHRKGVWSHRRPQWSMYRSINRHDNAASEHPLLWIDLEYS